MTYQILKCVREECLREDLQENICLVDARDAWEIFLLQMDY